MSTGVLDGRVVERGTKTFTRSVVHSGDESEKSR